MMRAIFFVLLSFLLLSGCAGLSKDECLTADWQIIGFEDGSAGQSAARIGDHRRACAKHGVTPDKTAYDAGYHEGIMNYCSFNRGNNASLAGYGRLQVCPDNSQYQVGYEQGLQNFCTYDSGYDYGLKGNTYRKICPQSREDDFLNGYQHGRDIFTLQNELYGLENELNNVAGLREQNELDQDALKQQLILDRSLTAEGRAQILLDIDALRDADDDLEEQQDSLEAQIGDVHGRLIGLGVDI